MSKNIGDYATVGEYARAVSGADEWHAKVERERGERERAERRDAELAALDSLLVQDVLQVIRAPHGEINMTEGHATLRRVCGEIVRLAEGHAAQRLSVIGKYADAPR
jgi:hypothetical protein